MLTATDVRLHKYYAEAHVLNGSIGPVARVIWENNQDGYLSDNVANYNQNGITIKSGSTEVKGNKNPAEGWDTQATSTIQTFTIEKDNQEIVSADLIVGQISTEHHAKGYVPVLRFGNTCFVNLKIAGELIEPVFDFTIVGGTPAEIFDDDDPSKRKPEKADPYLVEYVTSPTFVANVKKQGGTANDKEIHCSLVTQIKKGSVTIDGHVISVPGFGQISLAELDVRNHFDLTMMRLTLDDGREITVAGPGTNGATRP